MKFQSVSIGIGLSVLSNLLAVSTVSSPVFHSSKALADEKTPEVSSLCPLEQKIAVTFLDSKCQAVKLEQPTTFYRYYSSDSNKYGRYLTTNIYKTNIQVIRKLALNQEWGNKATNLLKVTLPAGTTVYQGTVAPQTPTKCYPGGGQQTFIENTRDPNIQWVEAGSLIVRNFKCS